MTMALVSGRRRRLKPDVVHVLIDGRIVKTAGPELATEIENRGFDWIRNELENKE